MLSLDLALIEEVYHEKDGVPELIVPNAKIDKSKKGGTSQLALLSAAGRQAAGLEDFTSIEEIRKVANDYKRYDGANFSRIVDSMSNWFNQKGKGQQREVRLSRPGWDAAKKMIAELAGERID